MSSAMEQAPPAPPKGSTPKLYMTPHLAKRRDGLCPSLYMGMSSVDQKATNPGGLNKSYQTKSTLLLQVQPKEGVKKEDLELMTILENIKSELQGLVGPESDIVSSSFTKKGCEWKLELNPSLNGADENYRLGVTVFCADIGGVVNYIVDTRLVPKAQEGADPNPLAPPQKGFREGKAAFDLLSLKVRKSIVRLEFPEFPEGCRGKSFREIYQLNARLKSGSFATVCRGTHRATGRKVAIKCVLRKDLPPSDDAAIYDEVAILASLNHPHIVPLIDFFDEKDCYFIVMELMSGGDLFDRIGKKKSYSEADARDLIVKMLKAVAYCHTRKIAHCDMKPKNLLLMSDDNDSFIKLADFGFAARVHEPKTLTKQCGTPFFVSPEILMRKGYDQQSDMWSVGCIIYLLLSGNLPFMGRSQKELFRKIVSGKFDFDNDEWQDVSDDAKDLITKCLVLSPDDRITATDAVKHDWLKASRDRLSMITLQSASQKLKTFNARMKLRSAMIAVDWVSSLKRMSFMNSANSGSASGQMNGASASDSSGGAPSAGGNAFLAAARKMKAEKAAAAGESGGSGGGGGASAANPLLAAARKMKAEKAKEQAASGSSSGNSRSTSKRNMLAAANAMKAMSLKEQDD